MIVCHYMSNSLFQNRVSINSNRLFNYDALCHVNGSDFITVGDLGLTKLPCLYLFWYLSESLSGHLPRNLTLLFLVEPLTIYLSHWSRLAAALEHGTGWGGVCIQAKIVASGRCLLATSKSGLYVLYWVEFIIVLLVHHNLLWSKVFWNRVLKMWLMLYLTCRIDSVEFAILIWMGSQNISMRKLNFVSVLRCNRVFICVSQTEKLDVCMICTWKFRALDESYLTRCSGPSSTS